MSEAPSSPGDGYPPEVDTTVAHVARVYDYMLGGTTNFEVDRLAAERSAEPVGGMAVIRHSTRSNRAFLGRAVRWLAQERGIRQFLDLGSGLPTEQNVHQVAQETAPESRVVYVDNDPIVLAHAHTLLESSSEGSTWYINGDVRDVEEIILRAEASLDFDQPVAILLFTILHTLRDDEEPWALVAELVKAVRPGSYLAISHLTADFAPEAMRASSDRINEDMAEPFVLRTKDDILRFFTGTEMEEPGLVHINEWHLELPPEPPPPAGGIPAPIYGGVGRKR
jgi:SAM-dependent methyltransferase